MSPDNNPNCFPDRKKVKMNRVFKNPLFWFGLVILLELVVLYLVRDQGLKRGISLLLVFPALLIWRLEKYQRQIPFNRYSLVVALLAVMAVLTLLLAYKNLYQWSVVPFN
jgi:hypothetical protein